MQQQGRPYRVEKYNPKWKNQFEVERDIIAGIFGEKALSIEHIGSTSVPGMWAKPQIDIQVVVDNLLVVDNLVATMIGAGYNYHGDSVVSDEKYFTKDASTGERLVSVHVRSQDNPSGISAIYFRDYLRTHPKDREVYSEAKVKAYNEGKTDRVVYPKQKKAVLQDVLEKAKKWYEIKKIKM